MMRYLLSLLLFLATGCATSRAPVVGLLFSDGRSGVTATSNSSGTRVGEACMKSYLGLIAVGDASIEAARRNGGISLITSVDESTTVALGFIYTRYCVIVRGN